MTAIILQIVNLCVLGMGFVQFLKGGYCFIKKAIPKYCIHKQVKKINK